MRLRIDDEGFSLAELMVVCLLLGVVMAGVYGLSQGIIKGGQVNEAQASFARDSGEPMRIIDKSLMQAISVEVATPYQIQVLTQVLADDPANDKVKRMRVTATATDTLTYETWVLNSNGTVAEARSLVTWSTRCVNRSLGVPLFTFYDINKYTHAQVEVTQTAPADTKVIVADLRLSYQGFDFASSHSVLLRNRQ